MIKHNQPNHLSLSSSIQRKNSGKIETIKTKEEGRNKCVFWISSTKSERKIVSLKHPCRFSYNIKHVVMLMRMIMMGLCLYNSVAVRWMLSASFLIKLSAMPSSSKKKLKQWIGCRWIFVWKKKRKEKYTRLIFSFLSSFYLLLR